ncbi:hypothetical protein K6V98_03800 [Collinsella sp. AGMB00827]|uniref:HEAT repeat domain-containing protein n=1 Tax=Collinsella ureilytica TaxID=2869515 RepID=A0ABS7MM28_9ACTN|nr:hypothetical protein [Collinsella urealyticum]MBY4797480.1 hypothetical protein [Collinsella urealyticum]
MPERIDRELTDEERADLERILSDQAAFAEMIEELSGSSRRRRQNAAHLVALVAEAEPSALADHIPQLLDALERPEAQTRWEILDACSILVPDHAREIGAAFGPAEEALFDEVSAPLRLAAFRLLITWGSTERRRSEKVWPILDEAIQCYHGDLEYRDMLALLYTFATGKIDGRVAGELAGRLEFDAENGKGAYLRSRSSEIYQMLVKRFKLENPQKRARHVSKDDLEDDDEE